MCTFALKPVPSTVELWGSTVPTAEYYLKQAEIASRMALAEPDPEKARAMHIMALDFFDKANREQIRDAEQPAAPRTIERH